MVAGEQIALGHGGRGVGFTVPPAGSGLPNLTVQPNASGMGISADGTKLVVANNYNDSISVIDTVSRTVLYEHDLRPYFASNEGTPGVAGGTFPFAVVVKGNGMAYVSSDRDREVVVVDISSPTAGRLVARIKLDGNALGMTFDRRRPSCMWRRTTRTRSRSSIRRATRSPPRSTLAPGAPDDDPRRQSTRARRPSR